MLQLRWSCYGWDGKARYRASRRWVRARAGLGVVGDSMGLQHPLQSALEQSDGLSDLVSSDLEVGGELLFGPALHEVPLEDLRLKRVIVVGAGQAGLAMGHALARTGLKPQADFMIVDASAAGDRAWIRRWHSFRLFTPARHSSLPGIPFPGPRSESTGIPNGFEKET